jgi:hypothetical protein
VEVWLQMKLARSTRTDNAFRSIATVVPTVPHREVRASRCAVALAVTLFAVSPNVAHPGGHPDGSDGRTAAVRAGAASAGDRLRVTVPDTRHTHRAGGAAAGLQPHALASTSASEAKAQVRRVCVSRANVRSGPGLSYRVVTTLGRGARVTGPVTRGWIKLRKGRWISVTVTCPVGRGSTASSHSGQGAFQTWVRAIDPAGNAQWKVDHARAYTRGNIRGLTVFRGRGPGPSVVYIQPGMTWSKTKLVMAHEALHVRQIRYGGFAHSLRVFGTVSGMERAADCGATMVLRYVVRGGCGAGVRPHVVNLLAGRPA